MGWSNPHNLELALRPHDWKDEATFADLDRRIKKSESAPWPELRRARLDRHAALMRERNKRVRAEERPATNRAPKKWKWLTACDCHAQMSRIHEIVRDRVGYEFKLPTARICKQFRILRPRQVAMWLMRELKVASTTEIGSFYGCNHSTICFAVEAIREERRDSDDARRETDELLAIARKGL